MGLVNVPKIIDYRNRVSRHASKKYVNRTNGVKSITDIAIHHSLTLRKLAGSTAEGYARYHVNNLGWPGIGYTYVIEADGTIKYVNDLAAKTYHVGNHNNYAVGIVLSGDFTKEDPTKEQEQSLRNLVAALKKKYAHIKNVKGHSDYSGYDWKACPVFDYKAVLDGKVEKPSKPSEKPKPKPKPKEPSKPKKATIVEIQTWIGTKADGIDGPNTQKQLIKNLQSELNKQFKAGLVVDGIWGPKTTAAIVNIRPGAQGNLTKVLQSALYLKGYTEVGRPDGIYGKNTKKALGNFQRKSKLTVDYIAGRSTFTKLFS